MKNAPHCQRMAEPPLRLFDVILNLCQDKWEKKRGPLNRDRKSDSAANDRAVGKMPAVGTRGKAETFYRGITSPRTGFSSEAGRASLISPTPGSPLWAPGSVSSFDCLASARRAALSFCFCCRAISLCRFSKVNFVLAIVYHPFPFMKSAITAN
jgi:hypothetical protein